MSVTDQRPEAPPSQLPQVTRRMDLLAAVPIHAPVRGPTYILISDIPQPWRDEFVAAIQGKSRPQIPTDVAIAYAFTWKDWVRGKLKQPGPSGLAS